MSLVRVERDGPIRTVILNRAEKRNSLNEEMMVEVRRLFTEEPPADERVTVIRGDARGKIWLKDLFDHPELDIALRNGDRILVEEDSRAFTALGATGTQARVPFESQTLSALEAIATVGGLTATAADPTGVFILRNEPAAIASSVLARGDLVGAQRMVYVLDLTEPNGMFLARDFVIRDSDTLYVTEAPYVQWDRTIAALTGSLTSATALQDLTTSLTGG